LSYGDRVTQAATPNFDLVKGLSLRGFPDYSPHQRRWERSHRSGTISGVEGKRGIRTWISHKTLFAGPGPITRTTHARHVRAPPQHSTPSTSWTSRTSRRTVPGWVGRSVTRTHRVRAGGEEVEAPPHSVASAPREAPYDLTRPGKGLRPGAVRSTRGDSGRPPESPRTAPRHPRTVQRRGPRSAATDRRDRCTGKPPTGRYCQRATCMTVKQ
jgi:hypothetical protein